MTKFWELLERSVIVQASVTMALIGVACYLWGTGQEVPVLLASTLSLVMGFWFGSKAQQYINSRSK